MPCEEAQERNSGTAKEAFDQAGRAARVQMAEELHWREGDRLAKPNWYGVDLGTETSARHPRQL